MEALRAKFEQPETQTRDRKGLPSGSAGNTTRPVVNGEVFTDVEGDNQRLLSRKLPAAAVNGRKLQEWACDGNSSTIYAASTVYPFLEGCLTLIESISSVVYYSDTARIGFVKSASTGNDAVTGVRF